MSVPPTNVEAERVFSAAVIVCYRLQTRLRDETLDTFCYLRYYFQTDAQCFYIIQYHKQIKSNQYSFNSMESQNTTTDTDAKVIHIN